MASVIVLCGGRGTRMGSLGSRRQKTMCEIWGTPLLELVLGQVCPGVPDPAVPIVLLTGHRSDDVANAVRDWQQRIDPRIHTVTEYAPGAAGVLHLAQQLPEPILIIAGNVLLDYSRLLPLMLEQWQNDGRPVAAGSSSWRTSNHHTLTVDDTTITSWHRAPHRTGRYEVVDTYLITARVLTEMRTQTLSHTRALAALVPDGAVVFRSVTGDWLHIETPVDLTAAPSRKDTLCRPPTSPPSSSSRGLPRPASPPSHSISPHA